MNSILETIGNTPIIKIESNIYAKLEFFNPFGSIKDRAAYQIITDAEKNGILQKGVTIIEATSGNMGISLAAIGGIKGYKTTIVMPENMSTRRRELIKAYGGELILTDAKRGMRGAIEIVKGLVGNQSLFMSCQFENPSGVKAHFLTTAPEIDKQMKIRNYYQGCKMKKPQ